MNIDAVLCKICKSKKYAEDFIGGHLYMSTYKSIQNIEKSAKMSEDQEDMVDGAELYCKNTNDKMWKLLPDKDDNWNFSCVDRGSEELGAIGFIVRPRKEDEYKNMICFYSLLKNNETQSIVKPNDKLEGVFGEYCVVITNISEFMTRITKVIDNLSLNVTAQCAFINYIDDKDKPAIKLNPFEKLKKFSYQNEFRIVVEVPDQKDNLKYFEVGNLSDITHLVSTKDLINNTRLRKGILFIGEDFIG